VVTAGTDALNRFTYAADLFLAPHPLRLAGDLTLVVDALGNPTLDLAATSEWFDLALPAGVPVTLSELHQTAALGTSFVTRRWRSVASLRLAAEAERFHYHAIPESALAVICPGCGPLDLFGGSLTVALSRLVAGALSPSPENGFVWSATYRGRTGGSVGWSREVRSQLALYARVPGVDGFAHHVVAVRLAVGGTSGPLGPRYRVGGVSLGNVSLTYGQTLGVTRLFPVRGYRSGEVVGSRAATGTLEYRLPLALLGHTLGHLPLGADKVWLNAFADAGDAWGPGTSPQFTRLRSGGVELAADVAVNYDLLLRLRLGVAEPLAPLPSGGARRPSVYLAFASDF
jgi:hypothetical protein